MSNICLEEKTSFSPSLQNISTSPSFPASFSVQMTPIETPQVPVEARVVPVVRTFSADQNVFPLPYAARLQASPQEGNFFTRGWENFSIFDLIPGVGCSTDNGPQCPSFSYPTLNGQEVSLVLTRSCIRLPLRPYASMVRPFEDRLNNPPLIRGEYQDFYAICTRASCMSLDADARHWTTTDRFSCDDPRSTPSTFQGFCEIRNPYLDVCDVPIMSGAIYCCYVDRRDPVCSGNVVPPSILQAQLSPSRIFHRANLVEVRIP